jgi:hypothetical protein
MRGGACPRGRPAAPAAARSADAPYLGGGLKVTFAEPKTTDSAFDEYVSDPAKPVPFRARPIKPAGGPGWAEWLVDDQREASGRPDVAAFVSDVLSAPLKISGQPIANLIASTSGTDADWVVKVIDVYPDEVAAQPQMGGYQLMVSADIFRGRYREFETLRAIAPDRPLQHRFVPPTANHVPAGPLIGAGAPSRFRSRSEPANIRAKHFPRNAGRLSESDPADLSRARPGERHRASGCDETLKPMRARAGLGGVMSFRIAWNTTANCWSYFSSSSSSLFARSPCDSRTRRSVMKARMIWMFTRIARAVRKTLDNMATPCSVKA